MGMKMIDNKWFCEPNEQRESWCFLFLQMNDRCIICRWEVGYGNPTMLVRKVTNRKSREREIIKELLRELYYCREESITLITYGHDVLSMLRTRIILLDIEDTSLHGVKHISIEKLLEEYFLLDVIKSSTMLELASKMNIRQDESNKVQLLWHIFLRIGPMLPTGVIS